MNYMLQKINQKRKAAIKCLWDIVWEDGNENLLSR